MLLVQMFKTNGGIRSKIKLKTGNVRIKNAKSDLIQYLSDVDHVEAARMIPRSKAQ